MPDPASGAPPASTPAGRAWRVLTPATSSASRSSRTLLPRRRRHWFCGSLEPAHRVLFHFIHDLGVGPSGRLETRPRNRLGRFTIGVEVVDELPGGDAWREAIQAAQ